MWRDNKGAARTEESKGGGLDTLEQVRRERVRATLEASVEEALEAA